MMNPLTFNSKLTFSVILLSFVLLMVLSCSKDQDEPEQKGVFSASWVENDTGKTISAASFQFNRNYKMVTLYAIPSIGSSRNVSFLLSDTVLGEYPVWSLGSGYSSAMLNAFDPVTGAMMFNSDSGNVVITKKQPGWLSGTFLIYGHANTGNLHSIKGEFNYIDLK